MKISIIEVIQNIGYVSRTFAVSEMNLSAFIEIYEFKGTMITAINGIDTSLMSYASIKLLIVVIGKS